MKKQLQRAVLILLPLTLHAQTYYHHERTGLSFYFPRPLTFHSAIRHSMWHNFINNKEGSMRASVQAIGAFQHTLSHDRSMAPYFLIHGKKELVVAGDATACLTHRDVRAEWLGLPSDFNGKLCIDPSRREMGLMFEYNQDLGKFIDWEFFENSWIGLLMPVVQVKHALHPNTGSSAGKSIVEQLSREELEYGRFYEDSKSLTRIADLRIQFGRKFVANKVAQMAQYNTFIIPTESSEKAGHLFNPVVGFNGHWGLGTGVTCQFLLNRYPEPYAFYLFIDLEHIYLFIKKEKRTFDLRHKQWSRFLMLREEPKEGCPTPSESDELIPAASVLTHEIRVRAFNQADLTAGYRLITCNWELELAYGLWARGNELLNFDEDEFHIFNHRHFGIAGSVPGTSASESTIAHQAADDATFVRIRKCDLDLESGISRSALTHKISLSAGYKQFGECTDILFGLGGFIEIPHHAAAFEQWGIWAKIGASF